MYLTSILLYEGRGPSEPGRCLILCCCWWAVLSVAALNKCQPPAFLSIWYTGIYWHILLNVKLNWSYFRWFSPAFSSVFHVRTLSLKKQRPTPVLCSEYLTGETSSLSNFPRLLLSTVWLSTMMAGVREMTYSVNCLLYKEEALCLVPRANTVAMCPSTHLELQSRGGRGRRFSGAH